MRTWVKFGHTQHWVPVTFPLTSSRTRDTHTHTNQMWNITETLLQVFHISSYYSVNKHRHISVHATCKKCSHAEINLQEFRGNHCYDTTVCGLGHLDVTCKCCNKYITHWIFSFFITLLLIIFYYYSGSCLICWNLLTPFGRPLRWFKKRRSLSSSGQRSPLV